MDALRRIKRAVLAGRYAFSEKARIEMERDNLTDLDVAEAIVTAPAIYKRVRSTVRREDQKVDYLYVIYGTTLDGLVVYTKGKLASGSQGDSYYFLVSSKRAD